MSERRRITVDGNEAAASVAHRLSEVIAIYPITPSSTMGEFADDWSSQGRVNVWGTVPDVMEMQSEGGAAGAVHGSLQAGALTCTFTASQGLLLMIPNMYKIGGELLPFVMHVTARCLASHALSIFGDHSDVMGCRQTGFAMICSNSVQEVHDTALIAHAATLNCRVPFMHFFDGFRTSSEVSKIEELTNQDLLSMIDASAISAFRERALTPDRPKLRGTAQNPDVFFQAREACNPYYDATPAAVEKAMEQFAALTGRRYQLFDYVGHPEAERVIVLMGSGADVAHETVEHLLEQGEKVGIVKVRLYRPFSVKHFLSAIPVTAKAVAILDRTKEPGALGEPLFLDIVAALHEARQDGWSPFAIDPILVAGRYGLASKEFTPAMVKGVFDNLSLAKPKNHFTVGIEDDVTHTSIPYDPHFDIEPDSVVRALFYGLGADGTVGANKNSIKIIGEETPNYAQGYFVYDSKKSGAITTSHLRFGPRPIRSAYLVRRANFVACHQFVFTDKYEMLDSSVPGSTFLLNAPYGPEEVWDHLPIEIQSKIITKKLRFYVIDGYKVAAETGMGGRVNTIMQTCFFAISGVLQRDEAISKIKYAVKKTYGKKGDEVVRRNWGAIDDTLAHLHEVKVPHAVSTTRKRPAPVSDQSPAFVRDITSVMMTGNGDSLPVSAFEADGTWPTATTQWEKRNIAQEIPVWDPSLCIQCAKCSTICPHAAIRVKVYGPELLESAPETYKSVDFKGKDFKGMKWTVQVAPEDCTGCGVCVAVCPAKDKTNPKRKAIGLEPQMPLRESERDNYDFFLGIPDIERSRVERIDVKGSQLFRPLFEYSGACGGCGETPYVKLLTQLFGDRLLIANATGCSSIYGGNLPTTPYAQDKNGRGPAWANSLFEDNAEFGFGMRLAVDKHKVQARELLALLATEIGELLVGELLQANQESEGGILTQRERVLALRKRLAGINRWEARRLEDLADYLVRKSVWILGGDGWAYDIGYGGLDHVVGNSRDVNILVMDTEVYSNTGGQQSKATPIGAAAKFAAAGKEIGKKDLGLMAMSYRNAYVASVAMGANDAQTVKAFVEADSWDGPSIIIAYSHCIAHGYDLQRGPEQQKLAVNAGVWPLYRYDPRRVSQGEPPLKLDGPSTIKGTALEYMLNETRFRMVEKMDPKRFHRLAQSSQEFTNQRIALYQQLASVTLPRPEAPEAPAEPSKPVAE